MCRWHIATAVARPQAGESIFLFMNVLHLFVVFLAKIWYNFKKVAILQDSSYTKMSIH